MLLLLTRTKDCYSKHHLPDNKIELLSDLLAFVPDIPVLLTHNITTDLGLSSDIQNTFRELVYDDQMYLGSLNVKNDGFPSNVTYIRCD